jgi:hypothetical protein
VTTIVLLVLLMIASVFLVLIPGASELKELTNKFVFIVLTVKYISLGVFYMITKRHPR